MLLAWPDTGRFWKQLAHWCLTSYLHQQTRPSARRPPSCLSHCVRPVRSVSGNFTKTLYGTQTGRNDLLLTSTIEPLFCVLLSKVGSKRNFSSGNFNILCSRLNWCCANKRRGFLPKQTLTLRAGRHRLKIISQYFCFTINILIFFNLLKGTSLMRELGDRIENYKLFDQIPSDVTIL